MKTIAFIFLPIPQQFPFWTWFIDNPRPQSSK
jgi:hypothetical protein